MSSEDHSFPPASGEDFLIEPGGGAPQRAREARDLAQMIGPKTNPAVSVPSPRRAAPRRRRWRKAMALRRAAAVSGPLARNRRRWRRAAFNTPRRSTPAISAPSCSASRSHRGDGRRARGRGAGAVSSTLRTGRSGGQDRKGRGRAAEGARICRGTKLIDRAPTASIPQAAGETGHARSSAAGSAGASRAPRGDPARDFASLRDAITAGAPAAQYELALRLFEGRGLPKDQPAAARWFERAASLGLAPAQYRLGSMLEKGIGVASDRSAAKGWYLKAAEAGNVRAAHNLAVMDAESAGRRAGLCPSGGMVSQGGRIRRPRQSIQPCDPLRPRAGSGAGPAPGVDVVLARRPAGRRGRRQETRRGRRQDGPGQIPPVAPGADHQPDRITPHSAFRTYQPPTQTVKPLGLRHSRLARPLLRRGHYRPLSFIVTIRRPPWPPGPAFASRPSSSSALP